MKYVLYGILVLTIMQHSTAQYRKIQLTDAKPVEHLKLESRSARCKYNEGFIYNKDYMIYQACDAAVTFRPDRETFQIKYRGYGFAVDKKGVYYQGQFVKVDTTGLRVLASREVKEIKGYVNGIAGTNGISLEKAEGDRKTPEGVFNATLSFGLKDNPGSILEYRKIADGDYWVDDSNSVYYNKWVNIGNVKKDWNSAEDLKAAYPLYNYVLALNYNAECTPGKGSAIFIHCTATDNDTSSAGCIRIPEEYMKKLIQSVDVNTKIVIIENVDKLTSY